MVKHASPLPRAGDVQERRLAASRRTGFILDLRTTLPHLTLTSDLEELQPKVSRGPLDAPLCDGLCGQCNLCNERDECSGGEPERVNPISTWLGWDVVFRFYNLCPE